MSWSGRYAFGRNIRKEREHFWLICFVGIWALNKVRYWNIEI